jgi:hypothetical protein
MCYFAYSAVNPEVNPQDLEKLTRESPYYFRPGTRHDIKMAVAEESEEFRLTNWCCDCDFPLCEGNAQAPEVLELAAQLEKLRMVRGIKCVYLCKTWIGDRNKKEVTVHIEDVDLPEFLAGMGTETLCRIDLYPRL